MWQPNHHTLMFNFRPEAAWRAIGNMKGGVLLGVVGAMLVAGVLGAGAASILGTSAMHPVRANYGDQAYYLAESGFRYAASVLRSDETEERDEFWGLDGEEFEVPGGGRFTLELTRLTDEEDYDTEYAVAGDQSVAAHSSLDLAGGANLAPKNGLFVHQGSWYRYREFRDDALVDIIAAPHNQRQVASAQEINSGEDLPLLAGSAVPSADYRFIYNGQTYEYEEYANNVLKNVTGGDFPLAVEVGGILNFESVFPMEVTDGDSVNFASIIGVKSTGAYPGDESDLNVARTVTYWFYSADGFPGEMVDEDGFTGETTHDDLDGFDESWTGPGKSMGDFEPDDAEEGAVQVINAQSGHGVSSLAYQGGEILSADYEVQVKIKLAAGLLAAHPKEYLAGITLRLDGKHKLSQIKGYGVSFAKCDPDGRPTKDKDRFPDALVPTACMVGAKAGEPYMLLWRTNESHDGFNHDPKLLAWAPTPDGALTGALIKEWVTLLVRVEEITVEGELANRVQVMYGDPADHPRDEMPLQWPPNSLADEENPFHLITWEEVAENSGATLINGNKGVVTAPGELLYNPATPELEVGLHTWGENLEEKAWFDKFVVRVAGQGGSGGTMFGGGYIPPIQQ